MNDLHGVLRKINLFVSRNFFYFFLRKLLNICKNIGLFEAVFMTDGTMCVVTSPNKARGYALLCCFYVTFYNQIKPNWKLKVASFFIL